MDHQDFVLQLDRAPEGQGFVTRVIRSLAGEAEAPFVNPVPPVELDDLWQTAFAARQADRTVDARDARPVGSRPNGPLVAELSLEELGDRLFTALFRGPVRSCWVRSLAEAAKTPDGVLRLKLQLNLVDPALTPLAELPWEYLYSLEHGGFLGLQRKTPILRHMRLPLPVGRAPVAMPLRLLLVSSQPKSLPRLNLEEEGARIAAALEVLPGVETFPLQDPTIETLRETLQQRDFHVLHFMGHGGFDAESGQGVLYFTDRLGAAVPVSGSLLASHLTDLRSLRLVFVNACETARANARAPFAGVAMALLRAGLPAVVAMQRPIRDGSALEFSRTVYRRLAGGDPIEAAVTEGRLAIARGHGALLEWGTPVLFSRAEDGKLFTREPPAALFNVPAEAFSKPLAASEPIRSRRLPYLFGAVALAAGVGFGATQWPFSPETKQEPVSTIASQPEEPSALTTDEVPEISQKSDPQRKGKEENSPISTKPTIPIEQPKEPELKPPPPVESRFNSSYVVSEGSPASIPDLGAEVGAHFFQRDGYSLARFWVAPQGQGMLQNPPIMGPGSIEFPAEHGTYHLDVLSLSLPEGRAMVRLRFVP